MAKRIQDASMSFLLTVRPFQEKSEVKASFGNGKKIRSQPKLVVALI